MRTRNRTRTNGAAAAGQLDLFFDTSIPGAPPDKAGALALRHQIADAMTLALQSCGKARADVAAEMARLTGDAKCSEHMLNAYTAASREGWELSLQRAVAFDQATGTHALLGLFAQVAGAKVFVGRDALLAELGRAEILRDELGAKAKQIKKQMEEWK